MRTLYLMLAVVSLLFALAAVGGAGVAGQNQVHEISAPDVAAGLLLAGGICTIAAVFSGESRRRPGNSVRS